MSRRLRVACLGVAWLAFGCATVSGTLPPPSPSEPTGGFRAGSAKADITPMPGYPMGGFSAAGKISRGVWTRLQARAVVFQDAHGTGVAFVSCDLWGIPGGLSDRVAELVATEYGVPQLAREQIVVAATHTHHSPGNYSSSLLYNALASPEPGFDRELFDFLSHRIAGAIREAWEGRRPAVLIRSEAALGGIARNRSLEAFLENGEAAQQLLRENAGLPIQRTPFPVGGDQAYQAIDPTLTVIRAEPREGDGAPLAVLAFYALHPTSLGPATQVYNSDLFGVAATLVEAQLDGTAVAIFNGAEGDVSSNWKRQDRPSTLILGTLLAEGIRRQLDGGGTDVTGAVQVGFTRTRLDDLARPLNGASQLPGSEGDWSFFRDAGWREGLTQDDPEQQIEGHGVKKHPFAPDLLHRHIHLDLPWLLDVVAGAPDEVPLAVYRIGDVTLATLPGEFTTMLGRRISRSIAAALGTPDRVLLMGLANEYLSYFTTEAEYDAQHYEGGSMLYGPGASARVEAALSGLAGELDSWPPREKPVRYRYWAGTTHGFGVDSFDLLEHSHRLEASYASLGNVLMDETLGIPEPYNPFLVWIDSSPRWADDPRKQRAVTPRVSIEVRSGGEWRPLRVEGTLETDDALDFVTTVVASHAGEARWLSIWLVPDGLDASARYRFVVRSTSGRTLRAAPFTLGQARQEWGFVGLVDLRRTGARRP